MSARYFFEESEDRTVMLPQGRRLSEPAAGLRDGPFLLDGPAAAGLNEQMPDAYREDHPGSGPWEFERADEAAASGDLQPRETEAFEGPQDRESQENESVRDTPVWRTKAHSHHVRRHPARSSAAPTRSTNTAEVRSMSLLTRMIVQPSASSPASRSMSRLRCLASVQW